MYTGRQGRRGIITDRTRQRRLRGAPRQGGHRNGTSSGSGGSEGGRGCMDAWTPSAAAAVDVSWTLWRATWQWGSASVHTLRACAHCGVQRLPPLFDFWGTAGYLLTSSGKPSLTPSLGQVYLLGPQRPSQTQGCPVCCECVPRHPLNLSAGNMERVYFAMTVGSCSGPGPKQSRLCPSGVRIGSTGHGPSAL